MCVNGDGDDEATMGMSDTQQRAQLLRHEQLNNDATTRPEIGSNEEL
jgi:hypothetical protein